jgi:hypothetical protein
MYPGEPEPFDEYVEMEWYYERRRRRQRVWLAVAIVVAVAMVLLTVLPAFLSAMRNRDRRPDPAPPPGIQTQRASTAVIAQARPRPGSSTAMWNDQPGPSSPGRHRYQRSAAAASPIRSPGTGQSAVRPASTDTVHQARERPTGVPRRRP